MSDPGRPKWDNLNKEAVYHELYSESRPFRDYQLEFVKWAVSLFLAVAGGYITLITSNHVPGAWPRLLLVLFIVFLYIATALVVRHSDKRFQELRDYVSSIKPGYLNFQPADLHPKPHRVIQGLILFITSIVIILILTYPRIHLCFC